VLIVVNLADCQVLLDELERPGFKLGKQRYPTFGVEVVLEPGGGLVERAVRYCEVNGVSSDA
jgi:hypothetical protein